MSNYIINGFLGFGNFGDDWLLESVITDLKSIDRQARFFVLSAKNPMNLPDTCTAINRTAVARWRSVLKQTKAVITIGGIYQDESSRRSLLWYRFIHYCARQASVPIIDYGVGAGPLSRWGRRCTINDLKQHTQVSIRDQYSLQSLTQNNDTIPSNITIAHDICIGRTIPKQKQRHMIIFNPRLDGCSAGTIRLYAAFYSHLRRYFSDFGLNVVLLCNMHAEKKISKLLINTCDNAGIVWYTTIKRHLSLIAASPMIITGRYHSLIAAIAAHVPAVALNSPEKTAAYAHMHALPVISINNTVSAVNRTAVNRVKELYRNRQQLQRTMKQRNASSYAVLRKLLAHALK